MITKSEELKATCEHVQNVCKMLESMHAMTKATERYYNHLLNMSLTNIHFYLTYEDEEGEGVEDEVLDDDIVNMQDLKEELDENMKFFDWSTE